MPSINFDQPSVGSVSDNQNALSITNLGNGSAIIGHARTNTGILGSSGGTNGIHAEFNNLPQHPFPPPPIPVHNGLFAKTTAKDGAGVLAENRGGGDAIRGMANTTTGPSHRENDDPAILAGVWGDNRGVGHGVKGSSAHGIGMLGVSADSIGVNGISDHSYGVVGTSRDPINGEGVRGQGHLSGVTGESPRVGVFGSASSDPKGTQRLNAERANIGVLGVGDAGIVGVSSAGTGVVGDVGVSNTSGRSIGVSGFTAGVGPNDIGVRGGASNAAGSQSFAGKFEGPVHVEGALTKKSGGFKIDHPLDPANRYLNHAFVESSEMKNIYDGIVVLDDHGSAVIELPTWFEALNRDFRYQLTPIGAPAPTLHVAVEIADSQFSIGGGAPSGKVSWQVSGIRKDKWAETHSLPVEEPKLGAEQ